MTRIWVQPGLPGPAVLPHGSESLPEFGIFCRGARREARGRVQGRAAMR